MTRKDQILSIVDSFDEGVTRQTIAGALTLPINCVSSRVAEMLRDGVLVEDGTIHNDGYRRSLLRRAA